MQDKSTPRANHSKINLERADIKILILILCIAIVILTISSSCGKSSAEKVSQFGQYAGYSEAAYDGYERRS